MGASKVRLIEPQPIAAAVSEKNGETRWIWGRVEPITDMCVVDPATGKHGNARISWWDEPDHDNGDIPYPEPLPAGFESKTVLGADGKWYWVVSPIPKDEDEDDDAEECDYCHGTGRERGY